jgi:hypothetical protein
MPSDWIVSGAQNAEWDFGIEIQIMRRQQCGQIGPKFIIRENDILQCIVSLQCLPTIFLPMLFARPWLWKLRLYIFLTYTYLLVFYRFANFIVFFVYKKLPRCWNYIQLLNRVYSARSLVESGYVYQYYTYSEEE